MQHRIGRAVDRLSADGPGCGAEQREQLSRATPHVLMGVAHGITLRLPGGPRLWNRLVGPGLIFAPDLQPTRFAQAVGALDQFFLGVAWGSVVSTTVPSRRLRRAVPVGHQVRSRCQV